MHSMNARRRGGGLSSWSVCAALCALLALVGCGGGSSLRSGASADDVATAPRLANGEEVQAAIAAEYPAELSSVGIGGVVRLSLLVGRDGAPVDYRVLQGSGNAALDRAATRVMRVIRFRPATDFDGRPVQVWASFPIVFEPPER